jgi:hypothetical protein
VRFAHRTDRCNYRASVFLVVIAIFGDRLFFVLLEQFFVQQFQLIVQQLVLVQRILLVERVIFIFVGQSLQSFRTLGRRRDSAWSSGVVEATNTRTQTVEQDARRRSVVGSWTLEQHPQSTFGRSR